MQQRIAIQSFSGKCAAASKTFCCTIASTCTRSKSCMNALCDVTDELNNVQAFHPSLSVSLSVLIDSSTYTYGSI